MRLRSAGPPTESKTMESEPHTPELPELSIAEPEPHAGAGETPEQRAVRELEAERNRLLAQERIRILQEEIDVLRRRNTAEAVTPTPPPVSPVDLEEGLNSYPPPVPGSVTSRATTTLLIRKRSASNDAGPRATKRTPKMEKIDPYYGKNIREHREFQTALKLAFRLAPDAFLDDNTKIAFSLQYVKGDNRTLWLQHEEEHPERQFTWDEFMSFLLDNIKSPMNRELHVGLTYAQAIQRPGQSVTAFAAYLTTLESQINPPYNQKHLVLHLFTKLRPELRLAVTNYQDFPQTRQALVALAALLEENQQSAGKAPARNQDRP